MPTMHVPHSPTCPLPMHSRTLPTMHAPHPPACPPPMHTCHPECALTLACMAHLAHPPTFPHSPHHTIACTCMQLHPCSHTSHAHALIPPVHPHAHATYTPACPHAYVHTPSHT